MRKRLPVLLIVVIGYLMTVYGIYYFESQGTCSNIKNLSDAFWYSLVTLTTVGYGDYYPTTPMGKIISSTMILASLGVLGYIIGKLTEQVYILAERKKMGLDGTKFENHVIIVGWNRFSEDVALQLVNASKKICVITDNKDHLDIIKENFSSTQVFGLYSDFSSKESLVKANASKASSLMPCLKDDAQNLVFMLNSKKNYPNLSYVIPLNNVELKETFISAGVSYTISRNEIASKIVASYIFEPSVAQLNEDILASASEDHDYDMQQYYVLENSYFANKLYGEIFLELKSKLNVVAVGLSQKKKEEYKLIKLPDDNLTVVPGDYILLMTSGDKINQLEKIFGCKEGIFFK